MSSSDEKQSTIINNQRRSSSITIDDNKVILHDPCKQKIVLYNRRSQQISLCQLRWYHYANDEPVNLSKLLMKIKQTKNEYNNINLPRINNRCPLCHQHLPSIYPSISLSSTYSNNTNMNQHSNTNNTSSHHMHRDYFMLLDRSYALDSRRTHSNTSSASSVDEDEEKVNHNLSIDDNALNNGYYNKFFKVVNKLGSGSYGTVHLVKHVMHKISLGLFAIKIICVGDKLPRLIEILREVRALQRLHHRNVIDYKHSWLENYQPAINGPLVPTLFILMEYADCGNIMDYVMNTKTNKPKWLSEHEIWTIMFETCMGLQHLHEYGIVHRDLKPNNLLMTSLHTRHRIDFEDLELYDTNYRIVLSDLGQSEFLDSNQRINNRTGNTGTLGFAAPELILSDNSEWDQSVDIWSLGHLLYFLCFSRWPYDGCTTDEYQLYNGIISGKYPLLGINNIRNKRYTRSLSMIQLIDQLCQINKSKRPSLNWIIMKISNILKKHQYIKISNDISIHHPQNALPPPTNIDYNVPDLSLYPVIKYVPKCCNNNKHKYKYNDKLRKRHNNNKYNINYDADDNDDDGNDNDIIKEKKETKEKKLIKNNISNEINKNIKRKQMEMTMFVTMEKPIQFIAKRNVFGLMLKILMSIELVNDDNRYLLQMYMCICCVLLSYLTNNNINMYKKHILVLYAILSIVPYFIYATNYNDLNRIVTLFSLEIILLFIYIYSNFVGK